MVLEFCSNPIQNKINVFRNIDIPIEIPSSTKLLCRKNLCKWSYEIAHGMEFLVEKKVSSIPYELPLFYTAIMIRIVFHAF